MTDETRRGLRHTLWATWTRLRLYVGVTILGDGWLSVMTAHRVIADRARDCITPDGQVILARCKPLADALYAPMPGRWTLSATLTPVGIHVGETEPVVSQQAPMSPAEDMSVGLRETR